MKDTNEIKKEFCDIIEEYNIKIKKEKSILHSLDEIDTDYGILYELELERATILNCYKRIFENN